MPERQATQLEIDSIRTIYVSAADRETLREITAASGASVSSEIRSYLEDYMAGALTTAREKPVKTSIWVTPAFWESLRAKVKEDGIAVADVIAAGVARSKTQKRRRRR